MPLSSRPSPTFGSTSAGAAASSITSTALHPQKPSGRGVKIADRTSPRSKNRACGPLQLFHLPLRSLLATRTRRVSRTATHKSVPNGASHLMRSTEDEVRRAPGLHVSWRRGALAAYPFRKRDEDIASPERRLRHRLIIIVKHPGYGAGMPSSSFSHATLWSWSPAACAALMASRKHNRTPFPPQLGIAQDRSV